MALRLELPAMALLLPLGALPPGQGRARTAGLSGGGEPKPIVETGLNITEVCPVAGERGVVGDAGESSGTSGVWFGGV
jgi:hypothetical protein